MAKSSFLMKQLFRPHPAQKQNQRSVKKEDCPKLTSIMLILMLAMLAGVFLVKALT